MLYLYLYQLINLINLSIWIRISNSACFNIMKFIYIFNIFIVGTVGLIVNNTLIENNGETITIQESGTAPKWYA